MELAYLEVRKKYWPTKVTESQALRNHRGTPDNNQVHHRNKIGGDIVIRTQEEEEICI